MEKCRICNRTDLKLVLDLGHHPPSDAFLTVDKLKEPETHYPLQLFYCKSCGLVQIGHTVAPETLFNETYPYETGVNKSGVEHFREFAKTVYDRVHPVRVVDIGSNDGTLLEGFKEAGCEVVGVEPVKPIAENAKVPTLNAFWDTKVVDEILFNVGKADLITATNVLAHVADIHDFMRAVDKCLSDEGTFVVEAPYLYDMLSKVEYDTIYHEHLCYFAIQPMEYLMNMHGMTIYHYSHTPIHGGSVRYYISRRSHRSSGTLPHENFTKDYLDDFAEAVENSRFSLMNLLYSLKAKGKNIVGVSAPAKGNTLLNYCGVNPGILDYITEKSVLKIGRYTPGSHILVVPDDMLLKEQPDYALLLAWNWKDQIKGALKGFKGQWIIPVPEAVIE